MHLKKICTTLTLAALLAAPPLCPPVTGAWARETARQVVLTPGSSEALLNGTPVRLETPPVVVDGTTYLPVRFVAEKILGATVQWNPADKTAVISKGGVQISLSVDQNLALVNGEEVAIANPPLGKDGRTLVPLRFLAQNMDMLVEYQAAEKTITITEIVSTPEPVNLPPVITSLGLQREELKIGEAARYNYTLDNEAGESITAEEWSYRAPGATGVTAGQPRAFFQPGDYLLYLRVRDGAGNWSETASARFTVTEEVLMTEMAFKFSRPVPGEVFENVDNVNFNFLPAGENVSFQRGGPVLHMSNSPEVVSRPGVLYRSEAAGSFRLFYHHLNGSAASQYLYVIAENNGPEPVTLRTLKSGVAGPVTDYMSLGQVAAMRYLSSGPAGSVVIRPGEKVILNPGLRHLNPREAVTGMQDYKADGTITISVVMGPENIPEPEPAPGPEPEPEPAPVPEPEPVPAGDAVDDAQPQDVPRQQVSIVVLPGAEGPAGGDVPAPEKTPEEKLREKIDYLLSLPVLPRHPQQIRGVFPGGDCLVQVRAKGGDSEKFTLGKEDPGYDGWVQGVDPLTGDIVKSFGNYGVVYRVILTSPETTGVLLNPRGSVFKGAFKGFDGNVYKAPATGHFNGLQRSVVLGVLQAGQTAEFVYTPPSGSDTPQVIALIPQDFWD